MRISLYIPQIEDLWFRQEFMADPDTMSYNNAWGGTIKERTIKKGKERR